MIVAAYPMRKICIQKVDVLYIVYSKQDIEPSPNLTRQLQVWDNEDRTVPQAPYRAFLENPAAFLGKKSF